MIVIGVDPGTYICGYGVVENTGKSLNCLTSGFIDQPKNLSLPLRLKNIYENLSQVIQEHAPHEMSIEDVFVSKNIRSTLKLGEARGVAILSAASANIPVYEYSPTEVKSAITGNGRSNKAVVQKMIQSILGIDNFSNFDISDALAIAICHINNIEIEKKYGFKFRKKSNRKRRFSINDIPS